MRSIVLAPEQLDAVKAMHNGCILCGGVGSGKSRTSLAYYYIQQGGNLNNTAIGMKDPRDLYIITTAQKRDKHEWELEMPMFDLVPDGMDIPRKYNNKVIVDSWNNIKKYANITCAFFIFDEQRLIGSGAWVKAFYKIARRNRWILLSATPGDCWKDYIPVFVANGFYPNKTAFNNEHAIFNRFSKYPKIDRYVGEKKLIRFRDSLLVNIYHVPSTQRHNVDIYVDYDSIAYKALGKSRFNPLTNQPVVNAAEMCRLWRYLVTTDESRQTQMVALTKQHSKCIVFYNYDYELDILRNLAYMPGTVIAEWNGHKHEPIPDSNRWVYLVEYNAGSEGWNCILTDTIIFFSLNYSYRVMEQSRGRIDRRNTPFKDLYYYYLKTHSPIELGIARAIAAKKKFNEEAFMAKGG